ncbi:MAG: restriction endonuclease [Fibrobacteria bacterium]|nr:restriction endonuclease [Fibrobacteria bacterium]
MSKYFIFRVNYDDAHQWLMDELLKKGVLRQGWGHHGLELISNNGTGISKKVWAENYLSIWKDSEKEINGRYKILSRMLDIQKDDLIVIPKTINNYTLTICQAKEGYCFDFDSKETFWDDFRHTIQICNPRNYKYDSSGEAKLVASKFKAYQSAINNVWSEELQNRIRELYNLEPSDHSKTIKDITDEISRIALRPIAEQLKTVDPNYFEDVIMKCLEARGYEKVAMRKYDKKGADVDIIATYALPFFSELIEYYPTLLIQIKKKSGTDWNDEEGVDQLIKSSEERPNSIKILINTTDKLSECASEKAKKNGIHIIDGLKIFDFILKTEIRVEN